MKKFHLTSIIAVSFILAFISCKKSDCKEINCTGAVTLDYAPVCGCNNITYSNFSEAECHGIEEYTTGECDS